MVENDITLQGEEDDQGGDHAEIPGDEEIGLRGPESPGSHRLGEHSSQDNADYQRQDKIDQNGTKDKKRIIKTHGCRVKGG